MNFTTGLNRLLKLFYNPEEESNTETSVYLSDISLQKKNIVFYVGGSNDEVVASFIQQKFEKISGHFKELDCEFIFYPALKERDINEGLTTLSYHFPMWRSHEREINEYILGISPFQFYKTICEVYAQEISQTSFFMLARETRSGVDTKIWTIDTDPIENSIVNAINDINRYFISLRPRVTDRVSLYSPTHKEKKKEKYNAEDAFGIEASRISREVAEQIQTLLKAGQSKALLNIYHTLIKQTKLHKPELFRKFNEINSTETETPLSRLVVDAQYRIWLTDYDNLEIVMMPLPKTLYLFFLKHPEGMMLHDLVDHKKELLTIYSRITNSSSTSEIKRRINDMTDLRKNSMNEKCSRVKEAFVLKMTESIARNYYITGGRSEMKRIALPNNLRTFNS